MCIVELAPLAGNLGSILTEMCEDPHDMHVEPAHPEDRRPGMPGLLSAVDIQSCVFLSCIGLLTLIEVHRALEQALKPRRREGG